MQLQQDNEVEHLVNHKTKTINKHSNTRSSEGDYYNDTFFWKPAQWVYGSHK